MQFLIFLLYATEIFLCSAMPISSTNYSTIDRQLVYNQIVLGIFVFTVLGTILGACICCGRRKRGFEEFKNESILGENRSEFPIFRALSPEPEGNQLSADAALPAIIVVNDQLNLSQDRLLNQDLDNNNGPISPADLENIENNNAVDYIPNRNEVGYVQDNAQFTINRNNVAENNPQIYSSTPTSPLSHRDLTDGGPSSMSLIQQQIESQPSPPSPIALPISINEVDCRPVNICPNYHNPFNAGQQQSHTENDGTPNPIHMGTSTSSQQTWNRGSIETTFQNPFSAERSSNCGVAANNATSSTQQQQHASATVMAEVSKESHLITNTQHNNQNTLDDIKINNNETEESRENCSARVEEDLTFDNAPKEECPSLKSMSSEKSNSDINSVEEALLALDNVLADEDTAERDDENDDEDITIDAEDIMKHSFVTNNSSMEFETSTYEKVEEEEEESPEVLKLRIRDEATQFVDEVLSECQKILNSREAISEAVNPNPVVLQTVLIENSDFSTANAKLLNNETEMENTSIYNEISHNSSDSKIYLDESRDTATPPSKNEEMSEISEDADDSSLANNTVIDMTKFDRLNDISCESENCNSDSSNLKSADSFENIFSYDGGLVGSTPVIKNKFVNLLEHNENDRAIIKLKFNIDTTLEEANLTFPINTNVESNRNKDEPLLEISAVEGELYKSNVNNMVNDGTFVTNETIVKENDKLNETENVFVQDQNVCLGDGTFITEKVSDETFVADGTFICNAEDPPEIKVDCEESNSVDMTTVTPVNTPNEINYSVETWDRFISSKAPPAIADVFDANQPSTSTGGGWFLHPRNSPNTNNETFEVEEDDQDLSMTFEALRKQLAEVLPHAQGMAGPLEYSDDEDSSTQNDRTFDESQMPLNKYDELEEALAASLPPPPNEVIINYKRSLSPIMEESEEETCKTFILNETKYLDSTSPGYMESGEVALGVAKPLMASNDTLFNLEDTFGDDPFSPRASSQNDLNIISPVPPPPVSQHPDTIAKYLDKSENSDDQTTAKNDRPKMELNFEGTKKFKSFELLTDDVDICSPDQAKTFSEDMNLTDQKSSDLSVTADHDATFTTVEEKTILTAGGDNTYIKDDERISEISEPEWELTLSSGHKILEDNNSMLGIESLDVVESNAVIIDNTFLTEEDNEKSDPEKLKIEDETESNIEDDASEKMEIVEIKSESDEKCYEFSLTSQKDVDKDKDEGISSKEESGNETENSINDENDDNIKCNPITTSANATNYHDDSSNKENSRTNNKVSNLNATTGGTQQSQILVNSNILDFLNKEIEHASSQFYYGTNRDINCEQPDSGNPDSGSDLITDLDSNENVQGEEIKPYADVKSSLLYRVPNSNGSKIMIEGNNHYLIEYNGKGLLNNGNGVNNKFSHLDIIRPNKYQPIIGINGLYDIDVENDDNGVLVNHAIARLSGEEDPWSNFNAIYDIDYTTSENNEVGSPQYHVNDWESDEDDSNSSEEFMYVKGNSVNEHLQNNKNENPEYDAKTTCTDDIWISHQDQIPVASDNKLNTKLVEDSCDDSSSDVEEEFVPSSWDAEAQPARSALKSPDKSSSDKKRRSVAFKKQRYHSVYEYPREVIPLSPAYSEPQMWNSELSSRLDTTDYNSDSDVLDGFTISSSTRPFHGSQFNAQCNTWPTDSDFSWSNFQSCNDDQNIKYQNYSEIPIEWPREFSDFTDKLETKSTSEDNDRPDSGVGESSDILLDSVSLGDLCHTKSSLRLPLNLATVNNSLSEGESNDQLAGINSVLDKHLSLTTPSCMGSMDSLSSSSGGSSDRPISFSTFGKTSSDLVKSNNRNETNNDTNTAMMTTTKPAIVFIESKDLLHLEMSNTNNHDRSKRQSDSTDEDSGIENIMRSAK